MENEQPCTRPFPHHDRADTAPGMDPFYTEMMEDLPEQDPFSIWEQDVDIDIVWVHGLQYNPAEFQWITSTKLAEETWEGHQEQLTTRIIPYVSQDAEKQMDSLCVSDEMRSGSYGQVYAIDICKEHRWKKTEDAGLGGCFAQKCFKQTSYRRHRQSELDNFRKLQRTLGIIGNGKEIALVDCSGSHRIVRNMLTEAGRAAASGDKESALLLETISAVVEVAEPRRWKSHFSNVASSLGQLCAACLVVLYQPARPSHGAMLVDQVRTWSSEHTGTYLVLQYRRSIQKLLSSALPNTLANAITDPTPSLFVAASLILGILVATQYKNNKTNVFQKPVLVAGAVVGLLVTVFLCYSSGVANLIPTITAVIPTVTVAAFLSSQVAEVVRGGWVGKSHRAQRLRDVLERLHTQGNAPEAVKTKGIRFITLD